MITARHINKISFSLVLSIVAAFSAPSYVKAAAGSSSTCIPSASCTVGEFLFDDSYAPINSATCNLTSRYPDGTILHNSQAMAVSGQSDGWYSYVFTAPATTGYYRAQVCCTVGTEYLCIDKSFEVSESSGGASANEVASAVWSYSSRTLSGFGNLVSDVWSNSDRSLSSFGTLTRDIWLNATRTLTGTQGEFLEGESGDLEEIEKTVKENRLLLEKLVNEPIIKNFLEEDTPDVGAKIKETETVAGQLYINQQYLTSKVGLMISKWNQMDTESMLDIVMDLSSLLGEESDGRGGDTIFGQTNWIAESWPWEEANDVKTQTLAVKKSIDFVQENLAVNGKSRSVYSELVFVQDYLTTLEKLVGSASDSNDARTLYGKIKETESLAGVYDSQKSEIDALLAKWNTEVGTTFENEVDGAYKKVIAVNRVPKAGSIFSYKPSENTPLAKILKNRLLSMRALLSVNVQMLAKGANSPLSSTWLEVGSIVFKSMITNPSNLISQEVPLKYYLPSEVKKEDVLESDPGLTVDYDSERDQIYVEGKFTLGPNETKTLAVRVEDIWVITDEDVATLRRQAEELLKPLEKTSFYAQGVTIKTDIDVSLDKILSYQKAAITPDQQIRAYREAAIELDKVNEQMTNLGNLLTQAGSTNSLFGFIGGAQALAVWGLIIIMAVGFVFLAIYMKTINPTKAVKTANKSKVGEHKEKDSKKSDHGSFDGFNISRLVRFALPILFASIISASITAFVLKSDNPSKQEKNEDQADTMPEPEVLSAEDDGSGGEDIVRIDVRGGSVPAKSAPSETSETVMIFKESYEVKRLEEKDGWTLIAFDSETDSELILNGWVKSDQIENAQEVIAQAEIVKIKDTGTGWLRVRKSPGGFEIGKAETGETYSLLGVSEGFYQIEFEGESGYISMKYAEIVASE